MTTYHIMNTISGQDLGRYQGETPEEAIRAMLADAGCTDEPDPALVAEVTYWVEDESSYGVWIEAASPEQAAQEYVDTGDWPEEVPDHSHQMYVYANDDHDECVWSGVCHP